MRALNQKKTKMSNPPNKFTVHLVFFIGCLLFLSACDNWPKGVLSQRKMADVLTEMHKAEACMTEKGLAYSHYSYKAPYYKFILKKYGITQAQFDSSLVWYTKKPLKFQKIYDNVTVQLTDLQKDIKKGKYHPVDTIDPNKATMNIWNKRTRYILTKDSARTHLNFEITDNNLLFGDTYILKFLQQIAPGDSCTKQHIVFRINYANGKIDSVYKTAYHDSLLRRYTFRFQALRKLKIKSISGELLGSRLYKGVLNAKLDSISLYREFNTKKQDSLRKVVEKANPAPKFIPKKMNLDSLRNIKKTFNKKLIHPV